MAQLPQDRGEIVDDLPPEHRWKIKIAPDLPRFDGHAPSLPYELGLRDRPLLTRPEIRDVQGQEQRETESPFYARASTWAR